MSSTSTNTINNPYKLYFLARVKLQLHSLNTAGSIGNYKKLQEGDVIHGNSIIRVPVITGNALKNWHARRMVTRYTDLGGKNIHERHFRDMLRLAPEDIQGNQNASTIDKERSIITGCAICDVHGFLVPIKPPIRREGLIRFSFAVPVEEIVAQRLKFGITHNRVVPIIGREQEVREKEGEEEKKEVEMMIIKQEYASAIYAFDSVLDIAMIGRSQYVNENQKEGVSGGIGGWLGSKLIDGQNNEIALRAKAAILSFDAVLTGEMGANVSRASPLPKPLVVVAIVTNKSIPKPLHPYYQAWKQDLANILRVFKDRIEKVYVYGIKRSDLIQYISSSSDKSSSDENLKKELEELEKELERKIAEFYTWYELIEKLAEDVGNALSRSASKS